MNEQMVRDLNRRYARTVVEVIYKPTKEKFPIFVDSLHFLPEGVILVGNKAGKEMQEKYNDYVFLESPESGVFDFGGTTYVYQHRPERQWRKGICLDNSSIFSPILNIIDRFDCNEVRLNYRPKVYSVKGLKNLFRDTVLRLEEGIKLLSESDNLSVALNKKYFISIYTEANSYVLWRMDKPLCKFYPETFSVTLFEPIYRQEVIDFFNRQGVCYGIK